MAHCSQTRKGNLYESQLPQSGPYNASVEKVCKDDESFSRQYSSFHSNVRPENPQAITRSLEQQQQGNSKPGLFGQLLRTVLGTPNNTQQVANNSNHNNGSTGNNNNDFVLQDQDWPNPQIEEGQQGNSTGGTASPNQKEEIHQEKTFRTTKGFSQKVAQEIKSPQIVRKKKVIYSSFPTSSPSSDEESWNSKRTVFFGAGALISGP